MSGAPASSSADVDPRQVPVYPVLALTVEGRNATLNGRSLEVPAGTTAQDAAITAAAAEAARLPGGAGAIRVAARDTSTDRTWRLVVTADRRVLELPDPTSTKRRRPWLLPVLAAGTAVVLGGGTAAAVVVARQPPAATTAAATPAPVPLRTVGAGANLTVTPPPGFGGRATWSVALDARVEPIATEDGTVIAMTEAGTLALLDPATGDTTWTGQAPRTGVSDLHLTRIDDAEVVATGSGRGVDYWPLPATLPDEALPLDVAPVAPRHIDLPTQAELDWSGAEPLAVLPDQTAAIIQGGTFVRMDVPVGAEAVAASDGRVTAVDPAGRWWRLDPTTRDAGPSAALSPPAGATTPPVRVLAAGPRTLVAAWEVEGGQAVTLVDVASGEVLATASAPGADLSRAPIVRQSGGPALTVGEVFVDPVRRMVVPLGVEVTVEAVVSGHVYGTLRSAERPWVDISTGSGEAAAETITTTADPGLPFGVVMSSGGEHALVVADKVEQRLLHALPPAGASSAS